jgi:hypothetical protein
LTSSGAVCFAFISSMMSSIIRISLSIVMGLSRSLSLSVLSLTSPRHL